MQFARPLVSLLTLNLFSLPVTAQTTRRLDIQSKFDHYELLLTGNTGRVAGKTADLEGFKDLLPVLTNPLGNECPKFKGPPDVTVKENGTTRSIYLDLGLVTDGEHCLTVGGEGLLYFPIHRDFLIGPRQDAIAVRSPLKFFRQGVKLAEIKKAGGEWQSEDPSALLDWDFLERVENSLKSYKIRFRAQSELAHDKPKMIVESGDQAYEFYKITPVLWAVKKPGARWLEASDDWSFWYDFDSGILEDRYAEQIRALEESGKSKPERVAILDKLAGRYSRNLYDLYRKMVLNPDEDHDVQRIALQRLHLKPTLATALTMAKYLQIGTDEDFKKTASQILKAHASKGPLYKSSQPAAERTQVVNYWARWAAKQKPAP